MLFIKTYHGKIEYFPNDRVFDNPIICEFTYLYDISEKIGYDVFNLLSDKRDILLGNNFIVTVPYNENNMPKPEISIPVLTYRNINELLEDPIKHKYCIETGYIAKH